MPARTRRGLLVGAVVVAITAAAVGTAVVVSRASAGGSVATGTGGGGNSSVPETEQPVPSSAQEPAPADGQLVEQAPVETLDVDASGTAQLLDTGGGSLVLRLTGLDVDAGKGYVLYLVERADARSPTDGTLLGELKGLTGDENYAVPLGVDPHGPLTALIWSRSTKGPVARARLHP
jgi:hypothetical protein